MGNMYLGKESAFYAFFLDDVMTEFQHVQNNSQDVENRHYLPVGL